jgi:hypothetical protein
MDVHTYTHIHTHTYIQHNTIHVSVRGAASAYIHTCIHTYIHTCIHTYMQHTTIQGAAIAHTHTYTHIHTHTCSTTPSMYQYEAQRAHTYAYALFTTLILMSISVSRESRNRENLRRLFAHTHTYTHIHTHAHIYTHTYMQHNTIHVSVRGAASAYIRLCTLHDADLNESLGFEGISEDYLTTTDEERGSEADIEHDSTAIDPEKMIEKTIPVTMGAFSLAEVCVQKCVCVCVCVYIYIYIYILCMLMHAYMEASYA